MQVHGTAHAFSQCHVPYHQLMSISTCKGLCLWFFHQNVVNRSSALGNKILVYEFLGNQIPETLTTYHRTEPVLTILYPKPLRVSLFFAGNSPRRHWFLLRRCSSSKCLRLCLSLTSRRCLWRIFWNGLCLWHRDSFSSGLKCQSIWYP